MHYFKKCDGTQYEKETGWKPIGHVSVSASASLTITVSHHWWLVSLHLPSRNCKSICQGLMYPPNLGNISGTTIRFECFVTCKTLLMPVPFRQKTQWHLTCHTHDWHLWWQSLCFYHPAVLSSVMCFWMLQATFEAWGAAVPDSKPATSRTSVSLNAFWVRGLSFLALARC